MSKKYLLLFALGVSACGGGGDSGLGINTFAQLSNESTRLEEKLIGGVGAPALVGVDTPVTGSATYTGVMALIGEGGSSGDNFLGQVALSMNFDSEILDGEATNFWQVFSATSATRVDGTLNLDASGFTYDNPSTAARETFTTTVTGSLNVDGTAGVETVQAGSTIPTAFAGVNSTRVDMIVGSDGLVDGTVTFSDGSTFDPRFLAD